MSRPILLFGRSVKQLFYELDRDFGIFLTDTHVYYDGRREPRGEWTDESLLLRILLSLKEMEENRQEIYPKSLLLKDTDDKALVRKVREIFPDRFSHGRLHRIILREGRGNSSVPDDGSPPMGLPRIQD